MGATALSLNSMDFPRNARARRNHAFEIGLAPSAMSIPNTLLIDSDPLFTYAFERAARKFYVPVRTFESILALDKDLRWDYDLVIFDIDTVGGEFLSEIADDIEASHGNVPILAIGTGQPGKVDKRNWEGCVRGFSDKTWGVDAVLSDALHAFSSCGKNLPKKTFTLIK